MAGRVGQVGGRGPGRGAGRAGHGARAGRGGRGVGHEGRCARRGAEAGPSVGFEIFGPHHTNVWPGVQVVNCPALGFAQLPANGTVSGSGTWNQTKPNGTARVPAGRYTLVVENRRFSFPLRVLGH